jgi:benzylsuccinate CoA-transferase BbsF subunit
MYLDAHLGAPNAGVQGNESVNAAPHGVYPAAGDDHWLAIAVADDALWPAFEVALGWEHDPSLAGASARVVAAAPLDERVRAWTSVRDADEAAAHLQAHGISAMPVMGPDDHHADPHLHERAFIVELHHPEVGVEHHVGNPVRMSRTEQRVAAAAPCLGADTHRVLYEVLGLDATAVDDLIDRAICR